MCPSEVDRRGRTLPDRSVSLYDNAAGSDVKFLVGRDGDNWLIPAHRHILAAANPVFKAQFEGDLASQDDVIPIEDIDGRAFDYLLKFLYCKEVKFQSVETCVNTLYAANRYLCPELCELCVKYLDETLTASNVVSIYRSVSLLATHGTSLSREHHTPSAPFEDTYSTASTDLMTNDDVPQPFDNNNSPKGDTALTYWPTVLYHNCLQLIDEHADFVLSSEEIEDLEKSELLEIVKRDTLNVKSEDVVYSALERWSNRKCKREQMEASVANRKLVLDELIFAVRYGLMSDVALNKCELLDHPETLCSFRKKRSFTRNDSVGISKRSLPIENEKSRELRRSFSDSLFRKSKSKKKSGKEKNSQDVRSMSIDSGKSNKRKCSSCITEYLIDIISCIFD